ncbi:hypothetical protein EVG20_g5377 [Dentipellis fragilis]|uniref:Uncharacterized protein n=1 Tax=Dentipellis fragilis TaxID=205917 RepID=A0A4Y9YU59_9AGAM|nr:hypothetical protein EVG20_g5377 [Dentipellis fragilis]
MTSFVELFARAANAETTKAAYKAAKKTNRIFVIHTSHQCYDAHQQRIPCPQSKSGQIIAIVVCAIAALVLGVWLFCRFSGRRTERGVADSEAPVEAVEREEVAQPLTARGGEYHEQGGSSGYPPYQYQYPLQLTDTLPPYDGKQQEDPAHEPKLSMPSYHGQS